ncbi:MAG: hypothetical protein Q4E60_10560 [Bacteroidales bacterium]|nr:hypothetical protein [Bacteroidales bacterium]
MNKKLFTLLSGVAIITSASLQSCADEFDPQVVTERDKVVEEYNKNFEQAFGKIDPNHTFGFGITLEEAKHLLQVIKPKYASTRATSDKWGKVDTNLNQWIEDKPEALKKRVHVPGWPNDDNYYYYGDKKLVGTSLTEQGTHPAGDVTDTEIKLVSEWFRTHKITDENRDQYCTELHVSDFFVQNISKDYDYTDPEHDGNVKVTEDENGKELSYGMDHIIFRTLDSDKTEFATWTHVENFNGTMNLDPRNIADGSFTREFKYVISSGTEDFAMHPSQDTGEKGYYDKWVLVQLSWKETMADGIEHTRTGYYLAFDFQRTFEGSAYTGDDYYSNWIIKISPANYQPMDRWPKRIMCEDLGSTCDFDFNDAVFDLAFSQNTENTSYFDAVISVQAAGGTMPIYIGVVPSGVTPQDGEHIATADHEIHKLLGSNELVPINVSSKTSPLAIYRVKKLLQPTTQSNTDQLQKELAAAAFGMRIHIFSTRENKWYSVSGLQLAQNLHNNYKEGVKDMTLPAPQLFNCASDAQWLRENAHINDGYPKFKFWVRNPETETDEEIKPDCGEQGNFRLRWDKTRYFDASTNNFQNHTQDKINAWKGAWDDAANSNAQINDSYLFPRLVTNQPGNNIIKLNY